MLSTSDGAVFQSINVKAGQDGLFQGGSNEDSFTTTSRSYSKSYNWGYIDDFAYQFVAGHNAQFVFKRGSLTVKDTVIANY